MKKLFLILGSICLIYGIIVLMIIGFGNIFSYFFALLGILFLLGSFFYEKFTKRVKRIILCILLIGTVLFSLLEVRIVSYSMKQPEPGADYVILLGSGVTETGPSIDFMARIKAAEKYLKENPESMVIVTGAQGSNEPVSEASAAIEQLVSMGIDSDRIILEDQSYTTLQNLQNSRKLIEKESRNAEDCSIVIVSSAFHLYRARYIAEQIGFRSISCLGSHGLRILDPQYYAREFFACIKEWVYFMIK